MLDAACCAKGLVITGGLAPAREWFDYIRGRFDLVVAADSGLVTALNVGASVDRVVGDMDSLPDRGALAAFPAESVQVYSTEKDLTDTEIALEALRKLGCASTAIYGGGGGRLDHLMAILALFEREQYPWLWVSEGSVAVCIEAGMAFRGLKNRTVSFFPVGPEKCVMRSRGLKWQLDGLEWRKGDVGVSNVGTGDTIEIEMLSGRLLFVGPLDTLAGLGW